MIIFKFVYIAIVLLLIILLIRNWKKGNPFDMSFIPFKESMDLLNVPIVTFMNNGRKLHFLLDTGSDASYIRKECLKFINIKEVHKSSASIMTAGGETLSEGFVTFDISYKNQQFENDFEVADVVQAWDDVTREIGVTIHGILGSQFFNRYKYQIDFENLAAYSKM